MLKIVTLYPSLSIEKLNYLYNFLEFRHTFQGFTSGNFFEQLIYHTFIFIYIYYIYLARLEKKWAI